MASCGTILLTLRLPSSRHLGLALQWLLERPAQMKAAMLKAPANGNIMFDTSVMPKLTGEGSKRMAGGRGARAGHAEPWNSCGG